MFRGRFEHTLDPKGRLSIPSGFRSEIHRRSEKPPVLTHMGQYLALFPADDWEQKERDLMTMSDYQPDVQDFQRYVVGGACDCPVDNNGRILIPAMLRKAAGLGQKVIIAGVLNRIEIWDPVKFEEKEQLTLHRLDDIQRSVDEGRRTPPDA
jgi:MraZ protein